MKTSYIIAQHISDHHGSHWYISSQVNSYALAMKEQHGSPNRIILPFPEDEADALTRPIASFGNCKPLTDADIHRSREYQASLMPGMEIIEQDHVA